MRICVVGCGAVGSLFAANLATLDDVEVWAFDLNEAHVEAIKKSGLQLTGADEIVGHPNATSDPAAIPPCDFGIVATKAMHAAAAISATADVFSAGAVASVMNGVGNEETLAEHVERVIRGTTFPAGKLLEPGVVQWDVKGDTTFGPFEPRPIPVEAIDPLADACTRAGMPAVAVEDARPGQWRKVIFNAATNPMGALTGLTHGRLCERAGPQDGRLRARRRGQGGRRSSGHRARRRPGGADRPRRAPGRGVRPQGLDAAGRRGAAGRPRSTS